MDCFKREFKRYKQRQPPPDLSEVIDFAEPEAQAFKKWVFSSRIQISDLEGACDMGLRPCKEWCVYDIHGRPGSFAWLAFDFQSLSSLILSSVMVYTIRVSLCHPWPSLFLYESYSWLVQVTTELRFFFLFSSFQTYSKTRHTEFPPDLGKLVEFIATALQFPSFKPEAGIINYYHLDSTLSGHTDHSEFDLTAPLFSLSFGQSAIFLLGGKTRDQVPLAMYLRSGDIMIMAGDSRLAYHAVPRILAPKKRTGEAALPACLSRGEEETSAHCSEEIAILEQYLTTSRINVNVRQVLGPGKEFPFDDHEGNR
ncbi:nucleic acid dioxygenase ALKBH1-like [Orbicella faveolata]|uniref:nucleic acid dioxygenase ALKBH1-like n=1 Tax=Orbicella faveolata TaxID=48498 RepID=UPI0009E1CFDA|nr:nucleic acid dioxygenase ALKBH1-like [Orbicella faveolata]